MKKVILLGLLFAVCVTGCSKKEEPKAEPKEKAEDIVIETETVSYTHLDVYKRQEYNSPYKNRACILQNDSIK